jgi:hypothetical protein
MTPFALELTVSAGLFAGMLASLEFGYRIGDRDRQHATEAHEGLGALEAATFALLGLLLGFGFSAAMSRLDARRQLIVREVNAIGTAYLRVDLLPESARPGMRRLFREYLDARLLVYDRRSDVATMDDRMARVHQLQQRIWDAAIAAGEHDVSQNTARLVLPAVNEMIDVTTARAVALRTRLPPLILVLLIAMALASALLGGYAMARRRRRSGLHMAVFAAVVSITAYAVLDLDNPRFGLITLTGAEQVLRQLQQSIR